MPNKETTSTDDYVFCSKCETNPCICKETISNWEDHLDEFDAICPVCKSGIKQFIFSLLKQELEKRDAEWLSCLLSSKENKDKFLWHECIDNFLANAKRLNLIKD